MEVKVKFPTHKDHLNKTYLEELGHKMWSTKGARFYANKRLLTKDNLSNKAIGFLSAYLIIFGLLSVYQISNNQFINEKLIAFGTTTISILLLAFSQMEAAQDYKMRAHLFHECSLKISNLYNELRIFKTLTISNEEEKKEFSIYLSKKYQNVLNSFPNHDDIDFRIFQAKYRKYYNLTLIESVSINISYHFRTQFLYHFLIVLPLLLIIYFLYN